MKHEYNGIFNLFLCLCDYCQDDVYGRHPPSRAIVNLIEAALRSPEPVTQALALEALDSAWDGGSRIRKILRSYKVSALEPMKTRAQSILDEWGEDET